MYKQKDSGQNEIIIRWDYYYYNNAKLTDRPRSTYYVAPLLAVVAFLPF